MHIGANVYSNPGNMNQLDSLILLSTIAAEQGKIPMDEPTVIADTHTHTYTPTTHDDQNQIECLNEKGMGKAPIPFIETKNGSLSPRPQNRQRRHKVSYAHLSSQEIHNRIRLLNNESSRLSRIRKARFEQNLVKEEKQLQEINIKLKQKLKIVQAQHKELIDHIYKTKKLIIINKANIINE